MTFTDPKAESKAIGAYLSQSFTQHGPELHARMMQHALRCDRCREQVRVTLRRAPPVREAAE